MTRKGPRDQMWGGEGPYRLCTVMSVCCTCAQEKKKQAGDMMVPSPFDTMMSVCWTCMLEEQNQAGGMTVLSHRCTIHI